MKHESKIYFLPFVLWHPSTQKQLLLDEGQNALMKKVLDTYLLFFQINQSTATLRHVFAGLRLFVQKVQRDSCKHTTSTGGVVSFFLMCDCVFVSLSPCSSPVRSSRERQTCVAVCAMKSSSAVIIAPAPPRRRRPPCCIFSWEKTLNSPRESL